MHTELPVCKRCCFCLPLRYGLIGWGYLKLILCSLLLTFLTVPLVKILDGTYQFDTTTLILATTSYALIIIDFILDVILIIACHKKHVKLLKTFYYYSMVILGLTVAISFLNAGLTLKNYIEYSTKYDVPIDFILMDLLNAIVMCTNLALQFYIILLVRSEIMKLTNGCQFRFVNVAAEAQCTLYVQQEAEGDKGSVKKGVDSDEEIRIYV